MVFDVSTEMGVLQLLRHIHNSILSPEQKNEIRDLLFSYKNTNNIDIQKLTSLVKEIDITVVNGSGEVLPDSDIQSDDIASSQSTVTADKSVLGISRPVPTFAKVSGAPTASQKEDFIPVSPHTQPPITSVEVPVTKSEQATQDTPPSVQDTQVPQQNTSTSTTVSTEQKHASIAEDTDAVTPTQQSQSESSASTSVPPLERIKEIKKEVNALVGNPVNLIDVHNEIGREYMNALLDAMKKNNGGAPEELQEAMLRLENAYTEVKKVIACTADQTLPASAPDEQSTQEKSQSPTPVESDNQTKQSNPEPVLHKEELAPNSVSNPVTATASTDQESGFASVHQTHIATKEDVSSDTSAPTTSVPSQVSSVISSSKASAVSDTSKISPMSDASKEEVSDTNTMMSVAKQKQIKDLMLAKKQEAATTQQQRKEAEIASMDPLMTPEVTDGLKQLLSEWSLFKSSGLFGTGPSGIDHPLYKQLSKLNMTAIVAGRFEGASPQIKRSITDYMNGWRYEEGILQEQGELFEHYLRRVIKHILDKRK